VGLWDVPSQPDGDSEEGNAMETKQERIRRGLILARSIVRRLDDVGIRTRPDVSLEHQHLARRYVIRGVESGGAIAATGRYVTFAGEGGEQLDYLHPIDGLGVNGLHAVVVGPLVVRIDLYRAGRTCQLLITKHEQQNIDAGKRPSLKNSLVFRGVDGLLDIELWGKDRDLAGSATPQFWSRGGEVVEIPEAFRPAVQAATHGASCVGCSHTHYLRNPNANIGLPGFRANL
jgi:hypothetical protein